MCLSKFDRKSIFIRNLNASQVFSVYRLNDVYLIRSSLSVLVKATNNKFLPVIKAKNIVPKYYLGNLKEIFEYKFVIVFDNIQILTKYKQLQYSR